MSGIAGCCTRATTGHAAAAPPSSVMNSRRLMPASFPSQAYFLNWVTFCRPTNLRSRRGLAAFLPPDRA
jgi:hypothetical protein